MVPHVFQISDAEFFLLKLDLKIPNEAHDRRTMITTHSF